jgi:hypothetical protein
MNYEIRNPLSYENHRILGLRGDCFAARPSTSLRSAQDGARNDGLLGVFESNRDLLDLIMDISEYIRPAEGGRQKMNALREGGKMKISHTTFLFRISSSFIFHNSSDL